MSQPVVPTVLVAMAAGARRVQAVEWLAREGYGVAIASSRRGVERRLRERRVDLVLLDVALCVDDPAAMCDGVRTSGTRPPIVALVGDGSHLVDGLDAGAADYFVLPLQADETLARVRALLRTQARIDDLSASAATDTLTGLWNRCQLAERATELVSAAERSGSPLSCLMIDLDHFKVINDTHGHLAGDAVLRACARRIQAEVRKGDIVFRYGGEEFALFAPNTGPKAALVLGQRIVDAMRSEAIQVEDSNHLPVELTVTASAGGATWRRGMTARDLVARADETLLAAKHGGRDRAIVVDTLA